MGEIRKDLVRDNWVVVVTERVVKPRDLPVPRQGHLAPLAGFCPFCSGNEAVTPPELEAIRPEGSPADGPGWDVRAIPNKFTAFSPEAEFKEEAKNLYQMRSGFGSHEVVIETPEHGVEFHQHDVERITRVLQVVRTRVRSLSNDCRIKQIQIYKNRGLFGGASLQHSHMQLIAFPYATGQWKGVDKYTEQTGRCLLCDIMDAETKSGERVVAEENGFLITCPYASRFSYETWIIPREHHADFYDLDDRSLSHLAAIMKKITSLLVEQLDDPSYNIIINTAPVNQPFREGYHWYVEIFPRLIVQAGVEIATGFYMNPISPEWAAETLRQRWQEQ